MQLVSLNVEKLHGFLKIQIPFFDDLTVIVGVNGSGKTSALTLMAAMLRLDIAAIRRFQFEHAELIAKSAAGGAIRLYANNTETEQKVVLAVDGAEHDVTGYNLVQERSTFISPEMLSEPVKLSVHTDR